MPKAKYRTFNVRERTTALTLASAMRSELEREMVSGRDGSSLKRAAVKPFADHIDDFVTAVQSRNRDSMYCYNLGKLLARLAKECKWEFLRDIDADSVLGWRRKQTLKPKSIKGYLDALWAFCKWLVDSRRLSALPLRREDVQVRIDDEATIRALSYH